MCQCLDSAHPNRLSNKTKEENALNIREINTSLCPTPLSDRRSSNACISIHLNSNQFTRSKRTQRARVLMDSKLPRTIPIANNTKKCGQCKQTAWSTLRANFVKSESISIKQVRVQCVCNTTYSVHAMCGERKSHVSKAEGKKGENFHFALQARMLFRNFFHKSCRVQ